MRLLDLVAAGAYTVVSSLVVLAVALVYGPILIIEYLKVKGKL